MKSWRYVAAAFALGAAISLLVWAFAVRGLGLNHGLRSPYTIVAIIAIIASRRLGRGGEDARWPGAALLIAAAVVGAAGAGAAALLNDRPVWLRSFETHRLPGFTVAIPEGHEQLSGHEYSSGTLTMDVDRDTGVIVMWIPGDATREQFDQMTTMLKATMKDRVRATRVVAINGHDELVMDLEGNETEYVSMTACDGRAVFVESFGVSQGIHTRVVRSIVCKPEPHAAEEVGVDLDPVGLPVVEKSDGIVFYGGSGAALGATMAPAILGPGELQEGVSAMLSSRGFTDIRIEPRTPDTIAFTASFKEKRGTGLVRELGCGHRGALILSFVTQAAAAGIADQLASSIASARCR